jgi:hypothetical protein
MHVKQLTDRTVYFRKFAYFWQGGYRITLIATEYSLSPAKLTFPYFIITFRMPRIDSESYTYFWTALSDSLL